MGAQHVFDAAIALQAAPGDPGITNGHTHPAWANMVGPFGGITAATLLNAALVDPRRLGEPVSLTVNYAGPVADGPFTIEAQPARTNRSTQHWVLTLRQGAAGAANTVATTATALFATRRDTWGATDLQMPDVAPASAWPVTPPPPLPWTHNYAMRFVRGAWAGGPEAFTAPAAAAAAASASDSASVAAVAPASPGAADVTQAPDSISQLWLRDAQPRQVDALSLAAMSDVFFPRIYRRRPRVVPAGTVSITTYFHASAAEMAAQADRAVLACARGGRYTRGFFDQTAELWADNGVLLASSQQIVYFKE